MSPHGKRGFPLQGGTMLKLTPCLVCNEQICTNKPKNKAVCKTCLAVKIKLDALNI